jgi:hypothetical protein
MFNKIWIQWNSNSIQSNSSWNICGSHQCYNFKEREKKHHHVLYAWWFQMLIKFIPNFLFVVSLFFSTILIFLMIISNSCYFNSHFEFIFQISWTYWIPIVSISYWKQLFQFFIELMKFQFFFVSIYHWIGASILIIIFNCCSNSHIKNTNTIQKLHNIDTTDMKRHIRCVFLCPYCWVGSI